MPAFPFPRSASGAGAASGFKQTAGQGIEKVAPEMTPLHISIMATGEVGVSFRDSRSRGCVDLSGP